MERLTVSDAIAQILREANSPLNYREITTRLRAQGLTTISAKDPAATVRGCMIADINTHGSASRFIRVTPGTYGLRESQPLRDGPQTLEVNTAEGKGFSFTDAAEAVLNMVALDRIPMHYRDITSMAMQYKMIRSKGRTPAATMYAGLLTDIDRATRRGEISRFSNHGRGYFGLSAWVDKGPAEIIRSHNRDVRKCLHDRVRSLSAKAFENLIGELLVAMGFEDVRVTNFSGDGGIDVRGTLTVGGVIRTKMAVQAKKWKHNVQAQDVQKVRGSLGAHEQGLIITTSDYSTGAREEAQRVDATPVALMNGEQLVGLLVEYGIGIRREQFELIELEEDE